MVSRVETLPQAGRRRHPRRLPRRRARARARLPLPHRHRPSQDPARAPRGAARPHPGRRRLPAAAPAHRRARGARHDPHRQERARRQGAPARPGGRAGAAEHPPRDGGGGGRPAGRARGFPSGTPKGGLPGLLLDRTRDRAPPGLSRAPASRCSSGPAATTRRRSPPSRRCGSGLEQGITAGLAAEHRAFGELAVGDVSRKLVQIFFATTALKKDDGVPPGTATPRQIRRLGIVGAGFMGAGIAGTAVLNVEVDTRLKDADLREWGRGSRPPAAMLSERCRAPPAHPSAVRAAERAALRRRRTTAASAAPTW